MKFIADLFKPILTILVTVLVGAFILSVAWPAADIWIEGYLPVWGQLDPVIDQVRAWLQIHQPEEEPPWWRFWD
ncbi:hypothetical protein NHF40_01220 [Maricaulaceae bacterium EIL42A08]|nr:hypothetical protein [Maricaulaceae bacterium EIL42A08]MCP2679122.1 hypothetical protein [Maricaulaceae bacterium NA33B04]